jgi:hypothetical protein
MIHITEETWLHLGREFCNLKANFRKKYFYEIKKHKKTYALKYHNPYEFNFIAMASALDNLVNWYYPPSTFTIGSRYQNITEIFYNMNEPYQSHNIDFAYSNAELFTQSEKVYKLITDTLDENYNDDKEYINFKKRYITFHRNQIKRLEKGYNW